MADDNKDNGGADDEVSSSDLEAQIKELQQKKQAADARAAAKREAMGEDTFLESKPKDQGKFDGEIREPGWRWDRSRNDWLEHRGTDFSKNKQRLPHNFQHVGDGSAANPHRVEQVGRWL